MSKRYTRTPKYPETAEQEEIENEILRNRPGIYDPSLFNIGFSFGLGFLAANLLVGGIVGGILYVLIQ